MTQKLSHGYPGMPQSGPFEGKYDIVEALGRGGFGMVYLAYQASMDRHVALKMLRTGLGADQQAATQRFLQEVKIISKLRHPNTVTIHDFGEARDGVLYMVLEYIAGVTLKYAINHEGAQTPRRALHISKQIAKSLAEAHRYGVIHRDLKPANIMLTHMETERDFIKVLDFGVARLLETPDMDLTRMGTAEGGHQIIGTPRYMSPEQVRGEELTPASDLYSLGLILYEMVTGSPAVRGDSTLALISQQVDPQPLELEDLAALNPSLSELVRALTHKHASRRLASAADVAARIDRLINDLERETPAPRAPHLHAPTSRPSTAPASQNTLVQQAAPTPSEGATPLEVDLPPEPEDVNLFSDRPSGYTHHASHASPHPEDESLLLFALQVSKLVVLGLLAIIGVYTAFLTTSTIFGQFLSGQQRFFGALILSLAIPLLTALGQNSRKEGYEVVITPLGRISRIFIGTAILSFATSMLVCLAMSGRVVHDLRRAPNWFLDERDRYSTMGRLNAEYSAGVAYVVESSTRALGIYKGYDTGAVKPGAPAPPPTPASPPAPTRPSNKPVAPGTDAPDPQGPQNKPGEGSAREGESIQDEYIRW